MCSTKRGESASTRSLTSLAKSTARRGQKTSRCRHRLTRRGPKHQFIGVLVNKGQVFLNLILHPTADRLVTDLLGKDWLLSAYDASIVRPGGPMQALHTDQWWMPRPQPRNRRQRPAGEIRRGEILRRG